MNWVVLTVIVVLLILVLKYAPKNPKGQAHRVSPRGAPMPVRVQVMKEPKRWGLGDYFVIIFLIMLVGVFLR